MIVFGFNDTTGKFNIRWQGFTLHWYRDLFAIRDLTTALVNSLEIAVIMTVIATVLGTFMGIALGKYRFRGAGSVNLLLFANIAAPEIVLGAALLSMFLTLGRAARVLDDRHRARDVQHRLRRGDGAGPDGRAWTSRWRRRRATSAPAR